CPTNFYLANDQRTCMSNCTASQFRCKDSGRCIPARWKCDGEDDCGDASDEPKEECAERTCEPYQFRCKNNRCVPGRWQCDYDNDCGDNSDEDNCSKYHSELGNSPSICHLTLSTAIYTHARVCFTGNITLTIICNKTLAATVLMLSVTQALCSSVVPRQCSESEFACTNGRCIAGRWKCDGDHDCADGSDEVGSVEIHGCDLKCDQDQFSCKNGHCIPIRWRCDADPDCMDGSDEENCGSCPPTRAFRCQNDRVCLQVSRRCDGVNNCGDNSDELNCRELGSCSDEFLCSNGRCISSNMRCNFFNDCEDYDTKLNDCRSNTTQCGDGDEAHCVTNGTDSFCSCKPGFQKIGHHTCGDKNECLQFGVCSHICNNTKGSYKCSCHKYFTRINDTCKADSKCILYIADDNEIRSLDPGMPNWRYEQTFQGDASVRIDSTNIHAIIQTPQLCAFIQIKDLKMPRGIAVDWVAGNLYWTDSGRDVIEVAQLSGQHSKTLIYGMIDEPYAIVVNPQRGTMYWADWGNHPKIETAAMDGTLRQTLVQENIQWPTGTYCLAVDYFNERLYWADAKLSVIGSVRLDGSDPFANVTLTLAHPYVLLSPLDLLHPFSIDIFEDYIYGVTYINNFVFRVNKFGKGPMENLTTGINHATDIVLYHRYKQPEMTNPCDRKKCEWLCLLSPSGPVCTCPNNYVADNGTCTERPNPTQSPFCIKVNMYTLNVSCPLTAPPSVPCDIQCQNGGSCFFNDRQVAKCRCQPSYIGERCEINQCRDYCKNGGTCTASHAGERFNSRFIIRHQSTTMVASRHFYTVW
uniref:EGF-like domain-containing protein n=1 Tax=Neolamprologus brichardi TaxID=32507 RepID=A0A3Q4HZM6_NEOBR